MAVEIKNDRAILNKFINGATVDSTEEEKVLEKYALTGWVSFSANFKSHKAEARLTKRGKWLLKTM